MFKLSKITTHLIIILLHQISKGEKNFCGPNFCNNSKQHILCKFKLKGPANHCINYERTINSASDKKLLLDKINSRRNKVAAGEIRSLRAAENMMALEWNEELAIAAQRWADQCVIHSVPDIKDTCRDLDDTSVGQNIATIYEDAPGLTPIMLVDLWYIELLNVNSSVIAKYRESPTTGSDHYGYFTQLVWAETTHVGCGAVKFKEEVQSVEGNRNRTVYRLVCNFAPSGNNVGKSIYSNGLPCSRCPNNATCDFVFNALCTQNYTNNTKSTVNPMGYIESKSVIKLTKVNDSNGRKNLSNFMSWPEIDSDYDGNISFDFFTDLLESTTKSNINLVANTTICKDVLIVDDLFELLKKKLSDDQTLRELLLSTNLSKSRTTEETFTDASVADMLSHIYTAIESTTATKPTKEYINSTLLVDLVEAVIFRNNDKISLSTITDTNTQIVKDVSPVKIQAELGEIRYNSDFKGHYFFPEDDNDEKSSDKQPDNYYDMTDIPLSDVAFEIESLRRNKGTKDFLEEILETDFVTETLSQIYMNSNHSIAENGTL